MVPGGTGRFWKEMLIVRYDRVSGRGLESVRSKRGPGGNHKSRFMIFGFHSFHPRMHFSRAELQCNSARVTLHEGGASSPRNIADRIKRPPTCVPSSAPAPQTFTSTPTPIRASNSATLPPVPARAHRGKTFAVYSCTAGTVRSLNRHVRPS